MLGRVRLIIPIIRPIIKANIFVGFVKNEQIDQKKRVIKKQSNVSVSI